VSPGKVHIISRSSEPFTDRAEAGVLLAKELKNFVKPGTVVLGIPRGGLVTAREIARFFDADLDIVLSRKLGAPGNPELAIGAVSEDGKLFLHESLIGHLGVNREYIQEEKERQLAEIGRRTRLIREILPRVPLNGRTVIVTDDGVATGATMQAALWTLRQEHPQELIAALPVGPEETIGELARDCDEMVCLRAPYDFAAVGQFYVLFPQTTDDEVISILEEEKARKSNR
jgi:putative phosphoribosyl transferase